MSFDLDVLLLNPDDDVAFEKEKAFIERYPTKLNEIFF